MTVSKPKRAYKKRPAQIYMHGNKPVRVLSKNVTKVLKYLQTAAVPATVDDIAWETDVSQYFVKLILRYDSAAQRFCGAGKVLRPATGPQPGWYLALPLNDRAKVPTHARGAMTAGGCQVPATITDLGLFEQIDRLQQQYKMALRKRYSPRVAKRKFKAVEEDLLNLGENQQGLISHSAKLEQHVDTLTVRLNRVELLLNRMADDAVKAA